MLLKSQFVISNLRFQIGTLKEERGYKNLGEAVGIEY